jgi:hypothetical protein
MAASSRAVTPQSARIAITSKPRKARPSDAANSAETPAAVVPVWRDDPEAIASVIESPEFLDTASPVARLYLAYFGRGPDAEGLNYYVAQREGGRDLDAISAEFAGSREIELRFGDLDNGAFVERMFRNVFGDAGSAEQRAGWVAQLDSGAMTRGQVMLAFSESDAFRTASANEVFVSIAYTEIFGREPLPTELARWVAVLDAGSSGEAVIRSLLASR